MKKELIISIIIILGLLALTAYFLYFKHDNSNPELERNLENFFKSVSNENINEINSLVNNEYMPKENIEAHLNFWKEIYNLKEDSQVDIEIISCHIGQIQYNQLGDVKLYKYSEKVKCSKVDYPSPLGGNIGYYNVRFKLNGKTYYMEYNRKLKLTPPYIQTIFLKKVESIPERYKGFIGNKPYNFSTETNYKLIVNVPIEINLKSFDTQECEKLPVNPVEDPGWNIKSMCYEKLAYLTGNLDLCNKINSLKTPENNDFQSKADCIRKFSQERKDLTACRELYSEEDNFRLESGRSSTSKPYTDCVVLSLYNNPTEEGCNLLLNTYGGFTEYSDRCFNGLAHYTNDSSYCGKIKIKEEKENCLSDL